MKKRQVAFIVAGNADKTIQEELTRQTTMLINSIRKFHSEEELPIIVYGQEQLEKISDPNKFYKATPLFGRELIDDYDLVLKLDSDQIITGPLNHILDIDDYDVGTVLNINRIDPTMYGLVSCFNISPQIYYNCGLVAMRSKRFVDHWFRLCMSDFFNSLQYREQDLLNILCYYGDYKVRCFDRYDPVYKSNRWNGLIAKGEGLKMVLRESKLILPRGKDSYPDRDVTVCAYHWAGGKNEKKMNYQTSFNEDVIAYFDWLVSDSKELFNGRSKA